MKIIHLCPYVFPALAYGGPAKLVYELAVQQAKDNNEVIIITSDTFDHNRRLYPHEKYTSQVNPRIVYSHNLINSWAYHYRFFTHFGAIFDWFRLRKGTGTTHIHDMFVLPQLFIAILLMVFRYPYVVSPHGVLDLVRTQKKSFLKSLLYFALVKPVLHKASLLVATSSKEAQDLRALGFTRLVTVRNGLAITPSPVNRLDRTTETLTPLKLLYLGKLHPHKGLHHLLRALASLKNEFTITIVGPDDGQEHELRHLAKELHIRVTFIPYVDESAKAELFSHHDLFVYPSASEGFSISILEAMAAGLPVLITRDCNFPEVSHHHAGFIATSNQPPELLRQLRLVLKHKHLLASYGQHGAKLVTNSFTIEGMATELQRAYRKALP